LHGALEKLTVPHNVKKFPAFNGDTQFIPVFTSFCHFSLNSGVLIQSTITMRHPAVIQ
jgi:hypothetical protein